MSDIRVFDNLLPPEAQTALYGWLKGPGWSYGAFSDSGPNPSRYWYKHFAGVARDGEPLDPPTFEAALAKVAPMVGAVWSALKAGPLSGHQLTRCYANGYPAGAEGGVHYDASVPGHYTAIYYPHLEWRAGWAGETVFFNAAQDEIVASAYPRPNRLVVFPGTMPHVARPITRDCPQLRITLMFKTMTAP